MYYQVLTTKKKLAHHDNLMSSYKHACSGMFTIWYLKFAQMLHKSLNSISTQSLCKLSQRQSDLVISCWTSVEMCWLGIWSKTRELMTLLITRHQASATTCNILPIKPANPTFYSIATSAAQHLSVLPPSTFSSVSSPLPWCLQGLLKLVLVLSPAPHLKPPGRPKLLE